MLYDGEVVRDEQIAELVLLLKFVQKVDYLCLDGYVQSRYRLVSDHEFRVQGKGSRYADPLPLSA